MVCAPSRSGLGSRATFRLRFQGMTRLPAPAPSERRPCPTSPPHGDPRARHPRPPRHADGIRQRRSRHRQPRSRARGTVENTNATITLDVTVDQAPYILEIGCCGTGSLDDPAKRIIFDDTSPTTQARTGTTNSPSTSDPAPPRRPTRHHRTPLGLHRRLRHPDLHPRPATRRRAADPRPPARAHGPTARPPAPPSSPSA